MYDFRENIQIQKTVHLQNTNEDSINIPHLLKVDVINICKLQKVYFSVGLKKS